MPRITIASLELVSQDHDDHGTEALQFRGTGLGSRSRFKRALGALAAGSKVRFAGPLGGCTLENAAPSVVMLAHVAITGADTRTTLIQVGAHHPFRSDTEAAATQAYYPGSREEFAYDAAAATRQVLRLLTDHAHHSPSAGRGRGRAPPRRESLTPASHPR